MSIGPLAAVLLAIAAVAGAVTLSPASAVGAPYGISSAALTGAERTKVWNWDAPFDVAGVKGLRWTAVLSQGFQPTSDPFAATTKSVHSGSLGNARYRNRHQVVLDHFMGFGGHRTGLSRVAFLALLQVLEGSRKSPHWPGLGGPAGSPADTGDATASPVPLPASLPLMVSGLAAFGWLGWRRRRRATP